MPCVLCFGMHANLHTTDDGRSIHHLFVSGDGPYNKHHAQFRLKHYLGSIQNARILCLLCICACLNAICRVLQCCTWSNLARSTYLLSLAFAFTLASLQSVIWQSCDTVLCSSCAHKVAAWQCARGNQVDSLNVALSGCLHLAARAVNLHNSMH